MIVRQKPQPGEGRVKGKFICRLKISRVAGHGIYHVRRFLVVPRHAELKSKHRITQVQPTTGDEANLHAASPRDEWLLRQMTRELAWSKTWRLG